MKTKLIKKKFTYTGGQLRPHFAYENYGLLGNSIVAWQGACDISFDKMVDWEDVLEQSPIFGDLMLHFIVEVFGQNLFSAVVLQRLLSSIVKDELEKRILNKKVLKNSIRLIRDGDDIFWGEKKVSISIASISPVSTQIHFAVNVTNDNTPVKTAALSDFGIGAVDLAESVLKTFSREFVSIEQATQKVKPLK